MAKNKVLWIVMLMISWLFSLSVNGASLSVLAENDEFDIHPIKKTAPFVVLMDGTMTIDFNYTSSFMHSQSKLLISVADTSLAYVKSKNMIQVSRNGNGSNAIEVTLKGKLLGRTKLIFTIQGANNSYVAKSYALFVEREKRFIDKMFTGVVILLVVLANIGMGCKIDLEIVKATLKRPIAPSIGMFSQFVFMPLIGFAIVSALPLNPGVALGFFTLACSPGGSASNVYTNFLNGNISLSVTMTLISSLCALGMIPLWLFTLGRQVYSKGDIQIPFANIITALIGVVVPIFIGLFLQKKLPKVANVFINAIKYIIVIFFIFVMTVGIYANIYIFYLTTPLVVAASALLPYLGFIFGSLVALIFRQKREDIIAIAVETGIQNTGIPIILCRLSLDGPDGDTGIVSPVISSILTPIPLVIAMIYVQTKAWREKRKKKKTKEGEEDTMDDVKGVRLNSREDVEISGYSDKLLTD